uniref:Uncharacterized protein n=1 Tax=Chromera velia CCMP2878 TaxID=1169474 RepID=A0A0G4F4P4_9ALVE|eukprot:Cvel_15061.t1-p1 / transcript=Cvel_15061.t1 / gene=Cvel_15061 / organism=Chromera_velia_CCMP2878 / gene_product=hypothetical protein / transcript_product=hypothetical protein / location=Cvel_scaffold1097:32608-34178(+) / protein_length=390 / sequence_SO=supercontig / SO=protein_coding / is_pseudo=false
MVGELQVAGVRDVRVRSCTAVHSFGLSAAPNAVEVKQADLFAFALTLPFPRLLDVLAAALSRSACVGSGSISQRTVEAIIAAIASCIGGEVEEATMIVKTKTEKEVKVQAEADSETESELFPFLNALLQAHQIHTATPCTSAHASRLMLQLPACLVALSESLKTRFSRKLGLVSRKVRVSAESLMRLWILQPVQGKEATGGPSFSSSPSLSFEEVLKETPQLRDVFSSVQEGAQAVKREVKKRKHMDLPFLKMKARPLQPNPAQTSEAALFDFFRRTPLSECAYPLVARDGEAARRLHRERARGLSWVEGIEKEQKRTEKAKQFFKDAVQVQADFPKEGSNRFAADPTEHPEELPSHSDTEEERDREREGNEGGGLGGSLGLGGVEVRQA